MLLRARAAGPPTRRPRPRSPRPPRPRHHVVEVDEEAVPVAGDDAAEAEWINIEKLVADDISGDHFEIIEQLRK